MMKNTLAYVEKSWLISDYSREHLLILFDYSLLTISSMAWHYGVGSVFCPPSLLTVHHITMPLLWCVSELLL